MRILLCSSNYPTRSEGVRSDADALGEFVRTWTKTGHEVTVLHAYLKDSAGLKEKLRQLLPGMRTGSVTQDGYRVHWAAIRCMKSVRSIRAFMMRRAAKAFQKELNGEYDLYLVHFPVKLEGLVETLQVNVPPVGVLHTADCRILAAGKGDLPEKIRALGFRSPRIQRDLHEVKTWQGNEFPVYSGAPRPRPHTGGRRDGALRVFYAGKLIRRKQADMLLRACAALGKDVPWTLEIAGEGELEAELKAYIEKNGLEERARLLGKLSREETLERMAASDVFAMVSYGETFGLTYMEAMASGALSIGTRNEGIDGVIVDGVNGYLIDAQDEAALTRRLDSIWRMSDAEWDRVAEAASRTVADMSEEKMAAKYLELAKEAVKGTKA